MVSTIFEKGLSGIWFLRLRFQIRNSESFINITFFVYFFSIRNCRFHGPDKVANRPHAPNELTAALQFLLPYVMKALMYWLWDQFKRVTPTINEDNAPMLYFFHRLHACGWVTQQLMVNVLLDPNIFTDLITSKFVNCLP